MSEGRVIAVQNVSLIDMESAEVTDELALQKMEARGSDYLWAPELSAYPEDAVPRSPPLLSPALGSLVLRAQASSHMRLRKAAACSQSSFFA